MTTQRCVGSGAIAPLLGIALVLLTSSCGESTSQAPPSTAATTPSPPIGGPVPAQVLGDWLLPAAAANAVVADSGGGTCQAPLDVATCMFKLTFTATTYYFTANIAGVAGFTNGGGDAVVNGTEMDFFNAGGCGLSLPHGVGRYTWTLTGGALHFVSLNSDPCPRARFLASQSYSRTG